MSVKISKILRYYEISYLAIFYKKIHCRYVRRKICQIAAEIWIIQRKQICEFESPDKTWLKKTSFYKSSLLQTWNTMQYFADMFENKLVRSRQESEIWILQRKQTCEFEIERRTQSVCTYFLPNYLWAKYLAIFSGIFDPSNIYFHFSTMIRKNVDNSP